MSGRVPPSSRAARASTRGNSERARAARIFERFTGHDPEETARIDIDPLPKVAALIGKLDAVEYTTLRDGVVEKYRHVFAAKDAPMLCVTPEGTRLLLVGGSFRFTARGIVDNSRRGK